MLLTLCLLWCQLEIGKLHYLVKQAKFTLIKHTVKAPLTFSPDWKRAHLKPSDMDLEEYPQHLLDILSRVMAPLPLLLFVCFLSSSSLCSPFNQLPSCWLALVHNCPLFVKVIVGEDLECQQVCVCEGQVNYVKVCVAPCVSILSYFCTVHVTVGGWLHTALIHWCQFNS